MTNGLDTALGAVLNIMVFGAIIWGASARTNDRRRRILLTLGLPVIFNVAVLILGSLTMEQRVWGAATTLIFGVAGLIWFQRQAPKAP